EEWKAITGFPVVYVKKIEEGLKRCVKETLKYISKFEKATSGTFSGFALPKEIQLLALVFDKLRRVRTRGIFYALPSEKQVCDETEDEKPVCCPICLSKLVTFDPFD